jgi:protein KRI1
LVSGAVLHSCLGSREEEKGRGATSTKEFEAQRGELLPSLLPYHDQLVPALQIEERLHEIEKVVGKGFKNNSNLSELLDEDWDPEKYEREMASQFNDDYYNEDDDEFGPPPDISDLLEDDDEYPGEEPEEEEQEEQEEDDYEGEAEDVDAENYEKQIEEALYQYDYEDLVAGMPCRFKYRQVEKEDYGLTIDDILDADDAELNKLVGLKAIVGYSDSSGHESGRVGGSYDEDGGYGGSGGVQGSSSLSDRQLKKQKKFEKKRKLLLKSLAEKRKLQEATGSPATSVATSTVMAKETSAPPPIVTSSSSVSVSETKRRKRRRKSGSKEVVEDEEDRFSGEGHKVEGGSEVKEVPKKKKRERKVKPITAAKKRLDLYG